MWAGAADAPIAVPCRFPNQCTGRLSVVVHPGGGMPWQNKDHNDDPPDVFAGRQEGEGCRPSRADTVGLAKNRQGWTRWRGWTRRRVERRSTTAKAAAESAHKE